MHYRPIHIFMHPTHTNKNMFPKLVQLDIIIVLTVFFTNCGECRNVSNTDKLDFQYHKYAEMTEFMKNFAIQNRNFATLYSIGKSTLGKHLWVIKMTMNQNNSSNLANIKLIGNIHGNEIVGKEMLLHLLEYIAKNYKTDIKVQHILKNNVLHILPSLNPDGSELSIEGSCENGPGRTNAWDVDLNRSFPDYFQQNKIPIQIETKAIINWMRNVKFILSASLHGGALVANYPFESVEESSMTPDDDVFQHLALTYSRSHQSMHKGKPCKDVEEGFKNGITNGADWYSFSGGMQDYNYAVCGCMEITLEISCCKHPRSIKLESFWKENKNALLNFCLQAGLGVKGIVKNGINAKPVPNAILTIKGRKMPFFTSKVGTFFRILLPGKYQLEIFSTNYKNKTVPIEIQKTEVNKYPIMKNLVIFLDPIEIQK